MSIEFLKLIGLSYCCFPPKACTRSEILDYTNRVSKYGQEIADKKRPAAFTFEIWEFMQNAKRNSCKNDPVQTIDGSTTNQLSTDDNVSQANANGNETQVLSDDDDDELFNWYDIFRFTYFDLVFLTLIVFNLIYV